MNTTMILHKAWKHFTLALLFEPRDLWVGAYWRLGHEADYRTLTVYVCLIPCLPVRADFYRKDRALWVR